MEKSEMMKRYEEETGECATWTWHEREFLTDDYIAWLESQLRWRPVSEKPESDGWILYKRWVSENKIETFDDTGPYFVGTQDEWMSFVRRCNVVRWLPIPPAPEGANMNHTKEPCPYCDETPKPIMERHGFKLSLDEDGDIFVSLELGSGTPARVYKTVNYCPMCGRKLVDV